MGGRVPPSPETCNQEISVDLSGKDRQGRKRGNGKKRRKIEKAKVKNWKWKEEKLQNEERTPFFFFCFSFFKMTEICFGFTKMEIFYWEKAFYAWKKIRKNDFAPSEKFSCYASGWNKQTKKKKKAQTQKYIYTPLYPVLQEINEDIYWDD